MISFNRSPKRATNLSLNAQVLDLAKEMGLNLSQTVDQPLAEEVRRRYKEYWERQNRQAIDAYNERIEREGTLGEQVQRWLSEHKT